MQNAARWRLFWDSNFVVLDRNKKFIFSAKSKHNWQLIFPKKIFGDPRNFGGLNEKSLENRTACIEMSDINGRVSSGSKTNSVDLCYSNVSGLEILKNPKYCKGLAFSIEERQILGEIFSKSNLRFLKIIIQFFLLCSRYLTSYSSGPK